MSIGGVVGFTNYAADDIKEDIKENVPGLAFIKALRPVKRIILILPLNLIPQKQILLL